MDRLLKVHSLTLLSRAISTNNKKINEMKEIFVCSFVERFGLYAVRYVAKLENGTIFEKNGQDGEELFQFVTDEGVYLTPCKTNQKCGFFLYLLRVLYVRAAFLWMFLGDKPCWFPFYRTSYRWS